MSIEFNASSPTVCLWRLELELMVVFHQVPEMVIFG